MLFFETLEEVPEQFRADYVESEYEGKKGFQHKKVVALANAYKAEKQEKSSLREKWDEYESRIESEKQAEVERKLKEQLEEALKNNSLDKSKEVYEQKLAHLEQQSKAREESFNKRLEALAAKQKAALASEFSSIATDAGKMAFERLIQSMVQVDPETGEETYFDENGNATSLDKKGFVEFLKQNSLFMPLIKAETSTKGGGWLQGGTGGNGGVRKKFNEYNSQELVEIKRNNPAEYQRLVNEFKS